MFSQQTIHAMNNPTATLETWECTGCYLPQVAGSPFYLGGPDLDRLCELCWEADK
jgi:hypothetical protein